METKNIIEYKEKTPNIKIITSPFTTFNQGRLLNRQIKIVL